MKKGTGIICMYISTDICLFERITNILNIPSTQELQTKTGKYLWVYEVEMEEIYDTVQLIDRFTHVFAEKELLVSEIAAKYNAEICIECVLYHPEVRIGICFPSKFIKFAAQCGAEISVDEYLWFDDI